MFASGLAAENAVLQAWLKPGRRNRHPARRLRRHLPAADEGVPSARLRRPPDRCGGRRGAARARCRDRTRLVWLESPTNPRLLVYDIAAIAPRPTRAARCVVVDNTFATPLFQQPFQLGADIVVHSVTKYLAGHSDLIQGAVLARDAAVFEPIKFLQNATGAVPSPFDCWLTLARLEDAGAAGAAPRGERRRDRRRAERDIRACRRVYYPGPRRRTPATRSRGSQMTGFGGMVSFELDGSVDEVVAFVSSRRFFALGESLGGVKSLICHPARMTHASIPARRARDARAVGHARATVARMRTPQGSGGRPPRGPARRSTARASSDRVALTV